MSEFASIPFPPRILREVKLKEGNTTCCDCASYDVEWASVSHGTLLCLLCAGKHRNLGVHSSFVRSIYMDTWSPLQLEMMRGGGNGSFLCYLEANGEVNASGQSSPFLSSSPTLQGLGIGIGAGLGMGNESSLRSSSGSSSGGDGRKGPSLPLPVDSHGGLTPVTDSTSTSTSSSFCSSSNRDQGASPPLGPASSPGRANGLHSLSAGPSQNSPTNYSSSSSDYSSTSVPGSGSGGLHTKLKAGSGPGSGSGTGFDRRLSSALKSTSHCGKTVPEIYTTDTAANYREVLKASAIDALERWDAGNDDALYGDLGFDLTPVKDSRVLIGAGVGVGASVKESPRSLRFDSLDMETAPPASDPIQVILRINSDSSVESDGRSAAVLRTLEAPLSPSSATATTTITTPRSSLKLSLLTANKQNASMDDLSVDLFEASSGGDGSSNPSPTSASNSTGQRRRSGSYGSQGPRSRSGSFSFREREVDSSIGADGIGLGLGLGLGLGKAMGVAAIDVTSSNSDKGGDCTREGRSSSTSSKFVDDCDGDVTSHYSRSRSESGSGSSSKGMAKSSSATTERSCSGESEESVGGDGGSRDMSTTTSPSGSGSGSPRSLLSRDFRATFTGTPMGLTLTKNHLGGALVTKIVSGGQAETLRVGIGDLVVGLNNDWVSGYDSLMETLRSDPVFPVTLVFRSRIHVTEHAKAQYFEEFKLSYGGSQNQGQGPGLGLPHGQSEGSLSHSYRITSAPTRTTTQAPYVDNGSGSGGVGGIFAFFSGRSPDKKQMQRSQSDGLGGYGTSGSGGGGGLFS